MAVKGTTLIGHIVSIGSVVFLGLGMTMMKFLIPEWLNPASVTFMKISGTGILLWISGLFIPKVKITKRDWIPILIAGIIGIYGNMFCFHLGITFTNPVDAGIIMTLPPVIVVLVSRVYYKTRIGWRGSIGILLAIMGALLVIFPHQSKGRGNNELLGDLLVLGCAICFAIYILANTGISKRYPAVQYMKWVYVFAFIGGAAFNWHDLFSAKLFHQPELIPWIFILFNIIFSSFLGYLLIPIGIRYIGQDLVSVYVYFTTIVTSLSSVAFGIDKISWYQPVATLLVIVGVLLCAKKNKHSHQTNYN